MNHIAYDYRARKARKQMKGLGKHPYFVYFIAVGLLLLVLLLNTISADIVANSVIRDISRLIHYYIASLGLCLLLGYGGLASLGTAGFMGVGAYVVTVLFKMNPVDAVTIPLTLTVLVAIGISIIIGVSVGFISLRIEGIFLAIVTLGLSEMLVSIFKNWIDVTGGDSGLSFYPLRTFGNIRLGDREIYIIFVILMLIILIMTVNIMRSPTGRAMLAMKNSTSAAQAMGVNILNYRLMSFIFATAYAALAGSMSAIMIQAVYPVTWSLALSLNLLAAVVIGGMKSIGGTAAGVMVVFGMRPFVYDHIPFFRTYPDAPYIFNGILIIIIVMFYPGGLARLPYDIMNISKKLYKKWRVYRYGQDDVQTI